jgi:hypothetical protein
LRRPIFSASSPSMYLVLSIRTFSTKHFHKNIPEPWISRRREIYVHDLHAPTHCRIFASHHEYFPLWVSVSHLPEAVDPTWIAQGIQQNVSKSAYPVVSTLETFSHTWKHVSDTTVIMSYHSRFP